MDSLSTASLVNILGFAVGIALYVLLLAMVFRYRKKGEGFDILLVLTAVLGFLWNSGEFLSLVWQDFVGSKPSPFLVAISYSALGFLPSVVVHYAENEQKDSRLLTITAYGLSAFAAFLHFQSAFSTSVVPSNPALTVLTVGSIALLAGLLFFNYRQRLENKAVWITALLIFAVSALHLGAPYESSNWFVELIAHQSSLPLVIAILLQDYRFAFADLFLKRSLSLLLLALTAFGLYVFIAAPLGALHLSHEENDALATGVLLALWISTALMYPFLHKLSVWFVDKILLRRTNYEALKTRISQGIEQHEAIEPVLDEMTKDLGEALTATKTSWSEVYETTRGSKLADVRVAGQAAEIFIPTNEAPHYKVYLNNLVGGRKLLSEEIEMLEATSLLVARRIDALRVLHERCEREIREQEFTKLTTEAQLTALRSQVNPHFLFNALTTIGYLIQTGPEKAFQTLMKLTQLLRSVLKSDAEFYTLDQELVLIENYLSIEKARFEERLKVRIDVPEDLRSLQVPSLILQPLVENAVKHGISENRKGGSVDISASLEKSDAGVYLTLRVFDTGAGRKTNGGSVSSGIGLENIRGRLESYYGNRAKLRFEKDSFNGSLASLEIPVEDFAGHGIKVAQRV